MDDGLIQAAITRIQEMRNEAQAEVEADVAKWDELACGQDTEEAEASGMLDGVVAGLDRALDVLLSLAHD